jgi:transposase-like protein
MPRAYPDEFRVRAVSLIRAGQTVKKTASDLDVSCAILYRWVKQDKIDRGEIPGVPIAESREMRKARKRIRELENEVKILRRSHEMLGGRPVTQKASPDN